MGLLNDNQQAGLTFVCVYITALGHQFLIMWNVTWSFTDPLNTLHFLNTNFMSTLSNAAFIWCSKILFGFRSSLLSGWTWISLIGSKRSLPLTSSDYDIASLPRIQPCSLQTGEELAYWTLKDMYNRNFSKQISNTPPCFTATDALTKQNLNLKGNHSSLSRYNWNLQT